MRTLGPLGLGTGPLGEASLSDEDAERLVHGALDRGVTLFDTARSYGNAEERLGRALADPRRRERAFVVTKGGYGTSAPDWTGEAIRRGVEDARRRLGADVLDGFLLHSCPIGTLEHGEVVAALVGEREAGRVRHVGYSGEGDALAWAAARPAIFDLLECSVSPFDQVNLPLALSASARVIAKRPLGNAPWRFAERPSREDQAIYWDRHRAMALDPSPLAWEELAIRFAAFAPGVAAAICGTSSLAHLDVLHVAVTRGPLEPRAIERVRAAFGGWPGVI